MSLTQPPSLSRLDAQVPITALAIHEDHLLAASDSSLLIFSLATEKLVQTLSPRAFSSTNAGQPIHGIHVNPTTGAVLLWGSTAVSYFPQGWKAVEGEVWGKARDWIYAGALSPFGEVNGDDTRLGVVVTAHNDVVPFSLDADKGELVFGQMISPSRPILYSATVSWLSSSTLLVVGGTVFGEILVWRCQLVADADDTSSGRSEIIYTLTGHEGSIFGVTLSQPLDESGKRLLASCSDDRTIRLWDISEDSALSEPQQDLKTARETGFNSTPTTTSTALATAMGHASRIWGVRIVGCSLSSLAVYSFGEDATMQRWGVDIRAGKLSHEQTFSLNDGKHLWAHALHERQDGPLLLATGGADSRISLIEEPLPSSQRREQLTTVDINDIVRDAPAIVGGSKRAREIITRYDFLSADELVAMTSSGRVLRGAVGAPASGWRIVPVEKEEHAKDLGLCYALRAVAPGVVALGTTSGNVYLYHAEGGLMAVTSVAGRIMDLIPVEGHTDAGTVDVYIQLQGNMSPWYLTINLSTFTLQQKFELTNLDNRFVAVSALKARGCIFLGSRHGFLSVLKPSSSKEDLSIPVVYTLSPRSPDAISCIVEIPSDLSSSSTPPLYILTTSRDGYYRIYQVQDTPSISLELLHETPAPFGPILTGAYFTTHSSTSSAELILHGFRGKDYVLYNHSQRVELASVHCGGAHRMHCLYTSPSSEDPSCMRFAFTRTSLLSVFSQESCPHKTLTPGTHGREIRAIASNGTYLATGSEDTTIRIWSCPSSSSTSHSTSEARPHEPHHLATVKAHNTGIQALHWLGPSHLLSSGGFEEFFVWRVRRLQHTLYTNTVAIVKEAKLEDVNKAESAGDLRIMEFDASWASEKNAEMIITMVLSDSTIKTYIYSETDGFSLLAKGSYTGACLMQVRQLAPSHNGAIQLVTGSTDGSLCIWVADISADEPGSKTYRLAHSEKIHQNTIKAMAMFTLTTGYLVLTGGDDNALRTSQLTSSESEGHFIVSQSAGVPRAHTASINGVSILSRRSGNGAKAVLVGVSASNDQRLKLWDLGERGERLVLREDGYSGVADPGDLEVLQEENGKVIVGGVGMEVWDVQSRTSRT